MKSRRIILLAMIFCLTTVYSASAYEAEIKKMSATMAEKIAATEKNKIAVVDFTDLQGDVTELGRFVAEEFSVALAGAGKGFKVVDRTHLKSIIKENKLSATGLIDPETARKLGKIAGVDALITGTLTPLGDSVRITVKILDSSTAEVIDATSGNLPKTEAVNVLFATSLTAGAPPSDKNKKEQHPTKENPAKPLQTTKTGGFAFQLMGCKLLNKNITCSFVITNLGKDRKLFMNGGQYSTLFDYEGNEYEAGKVQVADLQKDGDWVIKRLVSEIPVKSSISFVGISSKIKRISMLEIDCSGFKVKFHDIPLSK